MTLSPDEDEGQSPDQGQGSHRESGRVEKKYKPR